MPQNPFWARPFEGYKERMQEGNDLPAFLISQQEKSVFYEKIHCPCCGYLQNMWVKVPEFFFSTGNLKVRQKNMAVNLWKNLWRM